MAYRFTHFTVHRTLVHAFRSHGLQRLNSALRSMTDLISSPSHVAVDKPARYLSTNSETSTTLLLMLTQNSKWHCESFTNHFVQSTTSATAVFSSRAISRYIKQLTKFANFCVKCNHVPPHGSMHRSSQLTDNLIVFFTIGSFKNVLTTLYSQLLQSVLTDLVLTVSW